MNREREDSVTMKANLYFFFFRDERFFLYTEEEKRTEEIETREWIVDRKHEDSVIMKANLSFFFPGRTVFFIHRRREEDKGNSNMKLEISRRLNSEQKVWRISYHERSHFLFFPGRTVFFYFFYTCWFQFRWKIDEVSIWERWMSKEKVQGNQESYKF